MDLLNAYIHLDNVKIIKGLAISRISGPDSYGYNFTASCKYSIKSGYKTEKKYPINNSCLVLYGLDTKSLLG